MREDETIPILLDDVVSEIATILARGFMRSRKNSRLLPDTVSLADGGETVGESGENSEIMVDFFGE